MSSHIRENVGLVSSSKRTHFGSCGSLTDSPRPGGYRRCFNFPRNLRKNFPTPPPDAFAAAAGFEQDVVEQEDAGVSAELNDGHDTIFGSELRSESLGADDRLRDEAIRA